MTRICVTPSYAITRYISVEIDTCSALFKACNTCISSILYVRSVEYKLSNVIAASHLYYNRNHRLKSTSPRETACMQVFDCHTTCTSLVFVPI